MTKEQFIANNLFRFIGCGCQDECPKTKSEDDLYLVSLEYFGRYEDDDCNFTYMSVRTALSTTTRGPPALRLRISTPSSV